MPLPLRPWTALAVQDKTATGFVVQEIEAGASNVPFAYRTAAGRKDAAAAEAR
jgi:hypothetical protein